MIFTILLTLVLIRHFYNFESKMHCQNALNKDIFWIQKYGEACALRDLPKNVDRIAKIVHKYCYCVAKYSFLFPIKGHPKKKVVLLKLIDIWLILRNSKRKFILNHNFQLKIEINWNVKWFQILTCICGHEVTDWYLVFER